MSSEVEERCERTELLVTDCAHCRPKAKPWKAMFEGVCRAPGCSSLIEPGDEVRWTEDMQGVQHVRHR